MVWKEEDFLPKTSASIWMKLAEREHILIEDYITRNVNSTSRWFKEFKPLMKRAIPKKNIMNRSEGKLTSVIGSEIGPASTAKNLQRAIVGLSMQKELNRGAVVNNSTR
jgi:hypothetical protein